MLLCSNCHGAHFIRCAMEFSISISQKKLKDSLPDPWCRAVSLVASSSQMDDDHLISACIRCDFSSKDPACRPSFTLPAPLPGSTGKRKAGVLAARSSFRDHVQLLPSSVALAESPEHGTLTLHGYFHGPRPHTTRLPTQSIIANKEYFNNPSQSFCKSTTNNKYSGVLHFPQFNLSVQSQGRNYRPASDHHYLAEEPNSPAAIHGNVSQAASLKVLEYQEKNPHVCHSPVPAHEIKDICVPSPEDPFVSRKFRVAIIMIPQTRLTSSVQHLRGHTAVDSAKLSRSILFKANYIKNTDAILILGMYCLETQPCAPKVLLLRFPALRSSVSHVEATALLSQIGSTSGKHGFEFVRTCGSSGMTGAQSDRDLLRALHDCPTSLPRKVGACKVMTHNPFSYLITYRRVKAPPEDTVVSYKYCVPRRGGSFEMQPDLVARCPILAEFSYVKMIAVNLLHSLNQDRKMNGQLPLAPDALRNEMDNITLAREHFGHGDYLSFVNNYNLRNRYSLVAYPTAYHNDHLNKSSLENKLLLIDYTQTGEKSRGGSMFGNHYCFALLDWGHAKRSECAYLRANHHALGLPANVRATKHVKQRLSAPQRRRMSSMVGYTVEI